MSTWEAFGGAVLALGVLGGLVAIGFVAGYRGNWRQSAALVGAILGFFLIVQSGSHFYSSINLVRVAGGMDVVIAWLVTFGSFIGAIRKKELPTKSVFLIHAGFAVAAIVIVSLMSKLLDVI